MNGLELDNLDRRGTIHRRLQRQIKFFLNFQFKYDRKITEETQTYQTISWLLTGVCGTGILKAEDDYLDTLPNPRVSCKSVKSLQVSQMKDGPGGPRKDI